MKKVLHKDEKSIESSEFLNAKELLVSEYGEDFFKHLAPQGFFFGVSGRGIEIHKNSLANDSDSKSAPTVPQNTDKNSKA